MTNRVPPSTMAATSWLSPPGEPHGFTNTGPGELRLTAIHGAGRFDTEWLAGPDPVWTSALED